jgi:transcriptional regulator GlxA family with amidase domain
LGPDFSERICSSGRFRSRANPLRASLRLDQNGIEIGPMTTGCPPRQLSGRLSPATLCALRHIEQRFAEPLTLHDLAEVAGLNLFTLIKQFRRETGRTPHQHLCAVRVRAAQGLLSEGLSPAVAAVEAGFFDQSHLARHFKRHCGTTPGRYAAAIAPAVDAA